MIVIICINHNIINITKETTAKEITSVCINPSQTKVFSSVVTDRNNINYNNNNNYNNFFLTILINYGGDIYQLAK